MTDLFGQTDRACPFVRLVLVQTDGSTPRELGAAMCVDRNQSVGTIGGGQLEYEAMAHARRMLERDGAPEWLRDLRSWPLGPALGQCCGGAVRVLFERYGEKEIETCATIDPAVEGGAIVVHPSVSGDPLLVCSNRRGARELPLSVAGLVTDMLSGAQKREPRLTQPRGGTSYFIEPVAAPPTPLFIYGAGHVGQAIVKIVSDLAFDIHWVDTHAERFAGQPGDNVHQIVARDPAIIAAAAPSDAFHIVLTYSHTIDFAICHTLLTKPLFGFLGLIGSHTKRARFLKRLRQAGVSEAALLRLSCPIGIGALQGKAPPTIAVSIAAQLIEQLEQKADTNQAIMNQATSGGETHGAIQPIRA